MRLTVLVIFLSLILSIVNGLRFIISYQRTPPDYVYLGTIHYYEDYFFYLNHFFQGSHGAWLVANRYTGEQTPASLVYWPNLLLGKIGGVFGLPDEITYNFSIILLTFLYLLMIYKVLTVIFPDNRRLALTAFIYATLATALTLPVGSGSIIQWAPVTLWNVPHFAFHRLGSLPHHNVISLLALLLIFSFFRKKSHILLTFAPILLAPLLVSTHPSQGVLILGMLWLSFLCSLKIMPVRKTVGILTMATILSLGVFVYINTVFNTLPFLQSKLWEASQQTITTLPIFFASIGPVVFLACIGILPHLRRGKPIHFFGILYILFSYGLFISPIPKIIGISNIRFLGIPQFVFFGALAAEGTLYIGKKTHQAIYIAIVLLFLGLTAPTIIWEIRQKIPGKEDFTAPVLYLPKEIYQGFRELSNRRPFEDAVLANPESRMDNLVPALSGHTTYAGHMLLTINSAQKRNAVASFYRTDMTKDDGYEFLKRQNIRYVIFTVYDGNQQSFMEKYPFLSKVFENPKFILFEIL